MRLGDLLLVIFVMYVARMMPALFNVCMIKSHHIRERESSSENYLEAKAAIRRQRMVFMGTDEKEGRLEGCDGHAFVIERLS